MFQYYTFSIQHDTFDFLNLIHAIDAMFDSQSRPSELRPFIPLCPLSQNLIIHLSSDVMIMFQAKYVEKVRYLVNSSLKRKS